MTHLILCLFLILIASVSGHQSRRYHSIVHVPKAAGGDVTITTEDSTRCFQYTWLADEDPVSFLPYLNKTCFDKFGTKKPVPLCVNPMIVTDNNNEPDSTYLINNNYEATTCRLSAGYTCAKYTYYFNGQVQNITRYCTKISIEDQGPMNSGCVSGTAGVYDIEVCACNKMLGKMPCNYGFTLNPTTTITIMAFVLVFNCVRWLNLKLI